MDKVFYLTLTGTAGNNTIFTSVNRAQILKVSRQGTQKDFKSLLSGLPNTDQWSFTSPIKRIVFSPEVPFSAGEKIHIIYKVTT
jgi:hypothetical protein